MKSNLHGYLLAGLMIAIAVVGTAHHLATGAPEPPAVSPDEGLRHGVGLLERGAPARAQASRDAARGAAECALPDPPDGDGDDGCPSPAPSTADSLAERTEISHTRP